MQFVQPILFTEAIDKLGARSPIGSALNSEQWAGVPIALRERAFFSSQVENVRFLQRARDFIADFLRQAREDTAGGLALKAGSRQQFVKDIQDFAISEGMGPLDPDLEGTLQDITSESRLNLIFDVQTQSANDYGFWKQGHDPDVLDEFPAQRFIREREVKTPRPYHQQNEGVVRLKSDLDFWLAMNQDFNVPWGPWGYNSGMGVEDVDRDEAERLGLIAPDHAAQPIERDFNDHLQSSITGLDEDLVAKLQESFGDQAEIKDGAIAWKTPVV